MASAKRYLILAEGRSGDPHYGKTMRGVVRYGADPTVAVLDSERAGESHDGIPILGTVEEGLAYQPTTAQVMSTASPIRSSIRISRRTVRSTLCSGTATMKVAV